MKKVMTRVGKMDVSTVKIPGWADWMQEGGYETCLFYGNKSEVVEHYNTEVAALHGHISWVNKVLEEPV